MSSFFFGFFAESRTPGSVTIVTIVGLGLHMYAYIRIRKANTPNRKKRLVGSFSRYCGYKKVFARNSGQSRGVMSDAFSRICDNDVLDRLGIMDLECPEYTPRIVDILGLEPQFRPCVHA